MRLRDVFIWAVYILVIAVICFLVVFGLNGCHDRYLHMEITPENYEEIAKWCKSHDNIRVKAQEMKQDGKFEMWEYDELLAMYRSLTVEARKQAALKTIEVPATQADR